MLLILGVVSDIACANGLGSNDPLVVELLFALNVGFEPHTDLAF